MGAVFSGGGRSSARGHAEALHGLDVPAVDRESSSLAEKEAALEMAFFLETCRLKEFAAEGNRLAQILRREDNSPFASQRYEPRSLPLDSEGYARGFKAGDSEGIRNFFEDFGLVVVEDAIDSAACRRSRDELWAHLARECPGLDPTEPSTWDRWPALAGLGILGNAFLLSPQFCENRQAPAVYDAFRAVFNRDALIVNVGRASAMRPTRAAPAPAAQSAEAEATEIEQAKDEGVAPRLLVDRPDWRSKAGMDWLHWDLNPFTGAASTFTWRTKDVWSNRGYSRLHVQAILALSDCGPEDGGFFCVPGSHRGIRGWAHEHREVVADAKITSPESAMQMYLPERDPLKQHAQKAPIRAGSLLIWNSQLAHCNFPNNSSRPRLVQYVQMAEADDPVLAPLCASDDYLPPRAEFELSPLGRKLFGFEPWTARACCSSAIER